MSERYVTKLGFAQIIGVSERTVERMIEEGMPSHTWGLRCRRILPSEALRWAQERGRVVATPHDAPTPLRSISNA